MHDIETLITHFLNVSWGPVIPPGEACGAIEATKGYNSYYLISDGGTMSYRTRIRTPSFPHLQMIPLMCRGRDDIRPDRDPRQHRLRDGGCRPLNAIMLTPEERRRSGRTLGAHPRGDAAPASRP